MVVRTNSCLNRAQFLAGLGAAAVGAPTLISACGGDEAGEGGTHPPISREPGKLALLEFVGYEVPQLWKPYAKQFPRQKPKYTFSSNENEMLAKARAGLEVDMAHIGVDYTRDFLNAEVIEPWDLSLMANSKRLNPAMLEAGQIDGKQYHVPTDWGLESVLYRRDKVEPREESWTMLYDPRYKGKVSWFDDFHNLVIWAYVNGVDNPWDMSDEELEDARKALSEIKRKVVRNMWVSQTDFDQDFAAGNVWVGYAWNASWAILKKQGLDVAYVKPSEGYLLWIGGFLLLSGADDYHHAHKYSDAWASRQSGTWLLKNYAYGTPNMSVDLDGLDPALVKAFFLDDPGAAAEQSHLRQWLPRRREYTRVWDQIKAA